MANSTAAMTWLADRIGGAPASDCPDTRARLASLRPSAPSVLARLVPSEDQRYPASIIFDQDTIAESVTLIYRRADGCLEVRSSGRLHAFSDRAVTSIFANFRLDLTRITEPVYLLIQDSKSIRPWIGLEEESEFQTTATRLSGALGAYTGVLLVLLLVGVMLLFWHRSVLAGLYVFYVLVSLLYQFQALGIGPILLPAWPGPEHFKLMQAASVALVIAGIGMLIIGFLRLQGIVRQLIAAGLLLTCSCFFLSNWYPALYKLGALFIIPLVLLSVAVLVANVRGGDKALRWFALGLMASLLGGAVQAGSIISGGAGVSALAVFAFAIGNLLESVSWLLALATRLRDDQERLQAILYHDATHDALTGLPNRTRFLDHLEECLSTVKRNPDHQYALLFVDLDRFKFVNDSLGHRYGDQVLIKAAELFNALAEDGVVARYGGDEFLILLAQPMSEDRAIDFAARIGEHSKEKLQIEGLNLHINTSSGLVMVDSTYDDVEKIVRDVDIALYNAKHEGGGRCSIFRESMHEAALNRFRIEHELSSAIVSHQFEMYFQPIVDLQDDDRTVGFESLIRWNHPEHGMVRPDEFIRIAEETGQIVQLGDWILEECIGLVAHWKRSGLWRDGLYVSINISGIQLSDSVLTNRIDERMQRLGVDGREIRIELTETSLINNPAVADSTLPGFAERGIKLCMDDFGTGYSSLSYLNELHFDVLKIDRSFITNLETRRQSLGLVRSVMAMRREMAMMIVAEGIETTAQASILRDLGCDFGQGYLFSRPMDRGQTERHLAELADPAMA